MTAKTPCSANPDQWYTERDGRRYDDEPLVTEDDVQRILAGIDRKDPEGISLAEAAVDEATAEATRQRLIERRQARDACFGCTVRLECLDLALKNREQYGIWGGYYPEMRRSIERELDKREEARASRAL